MAKELTKKDIEYLSDVIDSQYIPDKWKKKANEMIEETKSESKEQIKEVSENEAEVFITFRNKDKGFATDKKYFKSYQDAEKWAKKEFEKFDPDFISYVDKEQTLNEFGIWNNARKKPKVNDFVGLKYIPTGIGVITDITDGVKYTVKSRFKDQTGLNFKTHIFKKEDMKTLKYDEVPSHILKAYSDVNKTKPSSIKQQLEKALKGIQIAIDLVGKTKELLKAKNGIEIAIDLT